MRPGAALWFEAAARLLLEEVEKTNATQPGNVPDKDQDVSVAAVPEPSE